MGRSPRQAPPAAAWADAIPLEPLGCGGYMVRLRLGGFCRILAFGTRAEVEACWAGFLDGEREAGGGPR